MTAASFSKSSIRPSSPPAGSTSASCRTMPRAPGAGTPRGLHAHPPQPQGKLVRAIEGEIWDVAVDIRRGSPTFGRWLGATLSEENFRLLWIPPGFAHGFCVLSENAQVEYKCTTHYDPQSELALAWNDPALAISWPIAEPLLSARDPAAPHRPAQGERNAADTLAFFGRLEQMALADELAAELTLRGLSLEPLLAFRNYPVILAHLLGADGMGAAALPKALLPF